MKSAAPASHSVWSRDDSAWCDLTDRCNRFELAVRSAVVDDQCRASTADCHGAIPDQAAYACIRSSRRRCRCFDTRCIDTGTRTLVRSAPTWIASLCSPRGISHCGSRTDRYRCTQRAPSCAATNQSLEFCRLRPTQRYPGSNRPGRALGSVVGMNPLNVAGRARTIVMQID